MQHDGCNLSPPRALGGQENRKGSFLEKVAKGREYNGADFNPDENSLQYFHRFSQQIKIILFSDLPDILLISTTEIIHVEINRHFSTFLDKKTK